MGIAFQIMLYTIVLSAIVSFFVAVLIFVLCKIISATSKPEVPAVAVNGDEDTAQAVAIAVALSKKQ